MKIINILNHVRDKWPLEAGIDLSTNLKNIFLKILHLFEIWAGLAVLDATSGHSGCHAASN